MRDAILKTVCAAMAGAALLLPACTDIEKCKIGTEGCVCRSNGTCGLGLQCADGYCRSRAVCDNTCTNADDGVCDDGGPNSQTSLCVWGSDCNDCGPRYGQQDSQRLCTDSCRSAGDGTCDDGGEDSLFSTCELGTDCTDCGPRTKVEQQEGVCEDTCESAGDGVCDDGGEGATYEACDWGTDCEDCGTRYGDPP